MLWQYILVIGIASLGIGLPFGIRRKMFGDTRWIHVIAWIVFLLVAVVDGYFGSLFWHFDFVSGFMRVIISDGFSLYFLNYPPAPGR